MSHSLGQHWLGVSTIEQASDWVLDEGANIPYRTASFTSKMASAKPGS
ncbi:MAG TPA: hypothetical protein VMV23_03365 [Candidatus Nanopelagicaceae bacterium]|nr:hypothetical protein [Candidatus Nanopelagicaceae bacterium]